MTRPARLLRIPVLLTVETAMVVTLHRLGQVPALRIDVAAPGRWLATVPPEDALAASLRLVALGVAVWLLLSTAAYLLARLSGVPTLVRATARVTLPTVRRTVERGVAAGLLAGTLTAPLTAGAQPVTPPPRPPDVVVRTADGGLLPPGVTPPATTPARIPTPTTTTVPTTGPAPSTARPDPGPDPPAADGTRDPRRDRADGRPWDQRPGDATTAERRVEPGDNLWSIARDHLTTARGTPPDVASVARYWRRLVEDNRGALRSGDPDLIHPGETISLPHLEAEGTEEGR